MIPGRLIRTVPEATTPQVEAWWDAACALHSTWDHLTFRDPIDPGQFPRSSPHWASCPTGAQRAGLVRLEALWNWGGFYLDSDVELYRPLTSLQGCRIVAGYEDPGVIPDAVIAASAGHSLISAALDLAIERLPRGPWDSGPGVTTELFAGNPDVLTLPPGSFYPYHYTRKHDVDVDRVRRENPWAFGAHHWHASWL